MVNHGLKSVLRKPSLISSSDTGGGRGFSDRDGCETKSERGREGGRGTIDLVGRASLSREPLDLKPSSR